MSSETIIKPNLECETQPEFDYKGFMQDFRIADRFGKKAVEDTFKRAHDEWKDNVQYYASLVLTLNHWLWYHYDHGDEERARLYDRLWKKADSYGCWHFKGDDLSYFYRFLD